MSGGIFCEICDHEIPGDNEADVFKHNLTWEHRSKLESFHVSETSGKKRVDDRFEDSTLSSSPTADTTSSKCVGSRALCPLRPPRSQMSYRPPPPLPLYSRRGPLSRDPLSRGPHPPPIMGFYPPPFRPLPLRCGFLGWPPPSHFPRVFQRHLPPLPPELPHFNPYRQVELPFLEYSPERKLSSSETSSKTPSPTKSLEEIFVSDSDVSMFSESNSNVSTPVSEPNVPICTQDSIPVSDSHVSIPVSEPKVSVPGSDSRVPTPDAPGSVPEKKAVMKRIPKLSKSAKKKQITERQIRDHRIGEIIFSNEIARNNGRRTSNVASSAQGPASVTGKRDGVGKTSQLNTQQPSSQISKLPETGSEKQVSETQTANANNGRKKDASALGGVGSIHKQETSVAGTSKKATANKTPHNGAGHSTASGATSSPNAQKQKKKKSISRSPKKKTSKAFTGADVCSILKSVKKATTPKKELRALKTKKKPNKGVKDCLKDLIVGLTPSETLAKDISPKIPPKKNLQKPRSSAPRSVESAPLLEAELEADAECSIATQPVMAGRRRRVCIYSSESESENKTPMQPTLCEPALTQPTPRKPALTQPTPHKPALTQPTPREPTLTQPTPREPTPTQPTPREPAPTQPPLCEPEAMQTQPQENVYKPTLPVSCSSGMKLPPCKAGGEPLLFGEVAGIESEGNSVVEKVCKKTSAVVLETVQPSSTAATEVAATSSDSDQRSAKSREKSQHMAQPQSNQPLPHPGPASEERSVASQQVKKERDKSAGNSLHIPSLPADASLKKRKNSLSSTCDGRSCTPLHARKKSHRLKLPLISPESLFQTRKLPSNGPANSTPPEQPPSLPHHHPQQPDTNSATLPDTLDSAGSLTNDRLKLLQEKIDFQTSKLKLIELQQVSRPCVGGAVDVSSHLLTPTLIYTQTPLVAPKSRDQAKKRLPTKEPAVAAQASVESHRTVDSLATADTAVPPPSKSQKGRDHAKKKISTKESVVTLPALASNTAISETATPPPCTSDTDKKAPASVRVCTKLLSIKVPLSARPPLESSNTPGPSVTGGTGTPLPSSAMKNRKGPASKTGSTKELPITHPASNTTTTAETSESPTCTSQKLKRGPTSKSGQHWSTKELPIMHKAMETNNTTTTAEPPPCTCTSQRIKGGPTSKNGQHLSKEPVITHIHVAMEPNNTTATAEEISDPLPRTSQKVKRGSTSKSVSTEEPLITRLAMESSSNAEISLPLPSPDTAAPLYTAQKCKKPLGSKSGIAKGPSITHPALESGSRTDTSLPLLPPHPRPPAPQRPSRPPATKSRRQVTETPLEPNTHTTPSPSPAATALRLYVQQQARTKTPKLDSIIDNLRAKKTDTASDRDEDNDAVFSVRESCTTSSDLGMEESGELAKKRRRRRSSDSRDTKKVKVGKSGTKKRVTQKTVEQTTPTSKRDQLGSAGGVGDGESEPENMSVSSSQHSSCREEGGGEDTMTPHKRFAADIAELDERDEELQEKLYEVQSQVVSMAQRVQESESRLAELELQQKELTEQRTELTDEYKKILTEKQNLFSPTKHSSTQDARSVDLLPDLSFFSKMKSLSEREQNIKLKLLQGNELLEDVSMQWNKEQEKLKKMKMEKLEVSQNQLSVLMREYKEVQRQKQELLTSSLPSKSSGCTWGDVSLPLQSNSNQPTPAPDSSRRSSEIDEGTVSVVGPVSVAALTCHVMEIDTTSSSPESKPKPGEKPLSLNPPLDHSDYTHLQLQVHHLGGSPVMETPLRTTPSKTLSPPRTMLTPLTRQEQTSTPSKRSVSSSQSALPGDSLPAMHSDSSDGPHTTPAASQTQTSYSTEDCELFFMDQELEPHPQPHPQGPLSTMTSGLSREVCGSVPVTPSLCHDDQPDTLKQAWMAAQSLSSTAVSSGDTSQPVCGSTSDIPIEINDPDNEGEESQHEEENDDGLEEYCPPHENSVLGIKVSGDCLFSCSSDKTVKVYDTKSCQEVKRLHSHKRSVTCVELFTSGNNTYIVSGSSDKHIIMCDAKSGEIEIDFCLGARVMSMLTQKHLLVAGLSNGYVHLINLQTKSALAKWLVGEDPKGRDISCLCLHNNLLFTACYDDKVSCWDMSDYTTGGYTVTKLHEITSFKMLVLCMQVEEDLLYCGSADMTLKVFNISTWQQHGQVKGHTGAVSGMCVSGNLLITSSFDHFIRCYDTKNMALLQVYNIPDLPFTLYCVRERVYCGLKSGKIVSMKIDLSRYYKCKWADCGLKFGIKDHLREHFKKHLSSVEDGPVQCKWHGCHHLISLISQHVNFHLLTSSIS